MCTVYFTITQAWTLCSEQLNFAGSQIESGITSDKAAASSDQSINKSENKRRRDDTTDSIRAAITRLASSRETTLTIVVQENGMSTAWWEALFLNWIAQ